MINLMLAGNNKVFDGILISILSILKHCSEEIHMYILTMDLSNINDNYKAISDEHIIVLDALLQIAKSLKLMSKICIYRN